MGLVGTLRDGTVIEKIPLCEFEGGLNSRGVITACDEVAIYRVLFEAGAILYACEEHAQQLWDLEQSK